VGCRGADLSGKEWEGGVGKNFWVRKDSGVKGGREKAPAVQGSFRGGALRTNGADACRGNFEILRMGASFVIGSFKGGGNAAKKWFCAGNSLGVRCFPGNFTGGPT